MRTTRASAVLVAMALLSGCLSDPESGSAGSAVSGTPLEAPPDARQLPPEQGVPGGTSAAVSGSSVGSGPAADGAIPASLAGDPSAPSGLPPGSTLGGFPLVERPLRWGDKRQAATLAYRKEHSGIDDGTVEITPRVVVLHWTAGPDAESAFQTFDRELLPGDRPELGGGVNVSAHYLVDRDGTIYRLLPETRMARHVIGLNHVAVGIENAGDGERWPLTEAQVSANAAIVRDLAGRHAITHVIGHHEYRAFEGHDYFREVDPNYRTGKVDPGEAFVAAVFARLRDLPVARAPGVQPIE